MALYIGQRSIRQRLKWRFPLPCKRKKSGTQDQSREWARAYRAKLLRRKTIWMRATAFAGPVMVKTAGRSGRKPAKAVHRTSTRRNRNWKEGKKTTNVRRKRATNGGPTGRLDEPPLQGEPLRTAGQKKLQQHASRETWEQGATRRGRVRYERNYDRAPVCTGTVGKANN